MLVFYLFPQKRGREKMEKLPSVKALVGAIIAVFLLEVFATFYHEVTKLEFHSDVSTMGSYLRASSIVQNEILENVEETKEGFYETNNTVTPVANEVIVPIVYDGMTLEELGSKLNRSMKSTLEGYGYQFANLAITYGVDPYVALAITLLETGCYHGVCSTLTSQCNNVGGMKGNPGCGGGSYQRFDTLESGMEAFIQNLSKNYYQRGLTTVEQIGKKYAESNTWSTKVNDYILKIKAN